MKPLAGYRRVSRVGDRKDTLISPEEQADTIKTFAKGRKLKIEMLDAELDVSGSKSSRPILDSIIEGVEEGKFSGIIVARLDRLSRMSMIDALKVIERIEEAGGQVIAVAENFDVATPEGRMTRGMFLQFNRMQWEKYAASFAQSKAQAVERGIWPFPKVPVGYVKDAETRKLVPGPMAKKVVRAFELRAAGKPWRIVAEALGGYAPHNARKVIQNRVYLGEISLEELVNQKAHPAIVGRSLFEAAQIEHPRPHRGPGTGAPSLLAGLIRCAGCRYMMSPTKLNYRCVQNKAGGRCEQCCSIAKNQIDTYVQEAILPVLELIQYEGRDRESEIEEATAALAEAESERDAFLVAVKASDLGADQYAKGLRERVTAVEEAERKLGTVHGGSGLPEFGRIRELWDGWTVEQRRHVLRSALGVVWVQGGRRPVADRVKVSLDVPPDLPGKGPREAVRPLDWENTPDLLGPSFAENIPSAPSEAVKELLESVSH